MWAVSSLEQGAAGPMGHRGPRFIGPRFIGPGLIRRDVVFDLDQHGYGIRKRLCQSRAHLLKYGESLRLFTGRSDPE